MSRKIAFRNALTPPPPCTRSFWWILESIDSRQLFGIFRNSDKNMWTVRLKVNDFRGNSNISTYLILQSQKNFKVEGVKSYVAWNLTCHDRLRDVKSYVTHKILCDTKSYVTRNLGDVDTSTWHTFLNSCVTQHVLERAAGASDPNRINDSTLGAAWIRTAARTHDEPLDQR